MAINNNKEFNIFEENIKVKAENLVQKIFPQKIIELQALLDSPELKIENLSDVCTDINISIPEAMKNCSMDNSGDNYVNHPKVLILPNGVAPCNSNIRELHKTVKPFINNLLEEVQLLQMWILILIPRIEDGNNFGVSIQEEVQREIRKADSMACAYLTDIRSYFILRADRVVKVAKYPHVEDYRGYIEECDQRAYIYMRLVVAELRNHYTRLYMLISKNLEKIKIPRSTNNENMF